MWRPKWDKREFVDDNDYVTTIKDCGKHLCRFLNSSDNTCRAYHERPFECALYPFILSIEDGRRKVYLHLACPYIQDTQGDPRLTTYIDYLKNFFMAAGTQDFLKRNQHLISDYAKASDELQFLFDV